MFNMKVVERGEGGDSRGPEKIVIPAVFQVFTFKSIPITISWGDGQTCLQETIKQSLGFLSRGFQSFSHVLLSSRVGSKDQTIVEPSRILVNKSLTHANLLVW